MPVIFLQYIAFYNKVLKILFNLLKINFFKCVIFHILTRIGKVIKEIMVFPVNYPRPKGHG